MVRRVQSKMRRSSPSKPKAVAQRSSSRHRKLWHLSKDTYAKLDDYQKEGLEFALRVKTAALIFEQGTGKTWIATGVVEAIADQEFTGLFIVPLNNLETTWLKTMSDQLPWLNICRSLDELKAAKCPRLLLMHYEAVPPIIKKLQRLSWDIIAYDESQRLKKRSSLTSRTASKLKACAEYKLILTGTPIDHNPQEFWAQFRFLRPDVLGTVWKEFEDEYMEPLNFDLSKYPPGSMAWRRQRKKIQIAQARRKFNMSMLPQFIEVVGPYAMSVRAEDVLDLPELRIHEEPVRLRGVQREVYEELEDDLVTHLAPGSIVTAPLKVTQLVKLRQVCGGFLLTDDGEPFTIGMAKMRRAGSIVNRLWAQERMPVVIFCCYTEEVLALQEEIPGSEILTGKVKKKDRPALIRRFQAGEIDVLICQIKTGGVGIDLFAASAAIMYSLPHSFIDYAQAIKRIHRRGQEKDCDVFLIYAEGTVDEDCLVAIKRKRRITDVVLTRLQRRRT